MLLGLIMALAIAEPADGPLQPGPITLDPTMFIERPSAIDLQRALERRLSTRAYAYGGPLHVTLACAVRKDGSLDACSVAEESPTGLGAGEVGLRLAREFKLPAEIGGKSVEGGQIRIPLTFRPPPR